MLFGASKKPRNPFGPETMGIPMAGGAAPTMTVQHSKTNWGGVIADALAGAAGLPGPYLASVQHKRDLAERSEQEAARDAQWYAHEDYQNAHRPPADDAFTRAIAMAGIDPASDEGRSLARNRAVSLAQNPDDAIVTVTLPGNRVYSGPRSGLAQALGGQSTAAEPSAIPSVADEAGYSAIPPGQQYRTPDGHVRIKGGAAPAGTPPFGADPFKAPGHMTSGRRTVQGNALVGGKPNSHHLTGDAADYTGTTPAALRAYYGQSVKIIPESDHLHVQGIGAGRVPYFGRRGTTGLRGN